jgi:hypothetical protein
MGGGGAAGLKVMGVLMVVMLTGVVEAGNLVRDGCKTFGSGGSFDYGCSMACGADDQYGVCPAADAIDQERPWSECDYKCVRHRPHVLLAPPASPTAALRVRFTTWCCTRSFVC